jgi:hypothetical protein
MEQENQEQDGEMKQEFQSYRDEIKNKVGLSNVRCTPRYLGLNVLPRIEHGPPSLKGKRTWWPRRHKQPSKFASALDHLHYRLNFDLDKFGQKFHHSLKGGNWQPNTLWGCQFPVCNTKWLKNGKLRRLYYPHFTTFPNETSEYY